MNARLESALLIGVVLSMAMFAGAWLARRRSARDRSALWAAGFAVILAASLAGLLVRPFPVALRLPRVAVLGTRRAARMPSNFVDRMSFLATPAIASSVPTGFASPARPFNVEDGLAALWLLVAGALLARWCLGFVRAARVLRDSHVPEPELAARLRAAAPGSLDPTLASIRIHSGIAVPITVSLLRSRILLPEEARLWREERLVAVLAHELAHLHRLDGPMRSIARLCTALHWFNPLVWLAARRLEETQEVAADDAILEAGWLPSCYARQLLAMADALNADRPGPALALTMVQRRGLMARLSLILGPARSYAFSPAFVGLVGGALAILGAGLVSLRPVLSLAEPRPISSPTLASSRSADGGYTAAFVMARSDAGPGPIAADGSVSLATNQARPGGIVADDANVYWLNFEGGTVMKLPRSGGEALTLADGQAAPQSIALDGERVYWSDFQDGTVRSIPISGGEQRVLAVNQDRPSGIAVDARHVYWVTRDGSLWSASFAGGDPDRLVAGEGAPEIETRSLVSDGTYLYWTDPSDIDASQGRILRYDPSERRVAVLADHLPSPCRLAVDAANVYWTNLGTRAHQLTDGTVMQVSRAGGTPVVLAAGQLQPLGIAVDAGMLYWTRAPLGAPGDGTVMRLALAGGEAAVAAWQQRRPAGLALKSGGVYWTDAEDGTVRSLKE